MKTGEFPTKVVDLIIARDKGCCVRCGKHVVNDWRGYSWSIHHRRARGMGGSRRPWVAQSANGIILCGSGTTGCHGRVESDRRDAIDTGFLISALGVATAETTCIQHHLYGWVLLDNDGGWKPAEGYGTEWGQLQEGTTR